MTVDRMPEEKVPGRLASPRLAGLKFRAKAKTQHQQLSPLPPGLNPSRMIEGGADQRPAARPQADRPKIDTTSPTISPTSSTDLPHYKYIGTSACNTHTPRSCLLSFHFSRVGLVVWELESSRACLGIPESSSEV